MAAVPMVIPTTPRCQPNRSDMKYVLFALIIGFGVTGNPAMAIEEPKFTVFFQEGTSAVAAEVTVDGDRTTAASAGFRLLAGYIFGGSTRNQSIAMTAPVTQTQAGVACAT